MYPRIIKVTLVLPWQPPQVALVREVLRGVYRLQITDRFGRLVNFVGTDTGFGVQLFKSTRNQSYLVVKGLWDEALYASESDKKASHVTILDIETDDC